MIDLKQVLSKADVSGMSLSGHWQGNTSVTTMLYDEEAISAIISLVRQEALEAAAGMCDDIERNAYALWDRTADTDAQGRAIGAMDCAAAIRTMKEAK